MLFEKTSAVDKRRAFRNALSSGKLQRMPGAFSPFVSLMIERAGFEGVYISGATVANDLGWPDIGLTTLTEVAMRARAISRVTKLPSLVDIDTGFGETMNVARTIQEFEDMGLCGVHMEDQINPKRCGHLDNKGIVDTSVMVQKIQAAVKGRRDGNFLIMARTDSRASEGLEKAIARAMAYVDAGADAIFPEAMENEKEFEAFRSALKVPLLANMTEFGKSKLLPRKALEDLGFNIVIYPVTSFRIAMGAVEEGLATIAKEGSQESLLGKMQHRKRLYEIVEYERYNEFDQSVFNFKLK